MALYLSNCANNQARCAVHQRDSPVPCSMMWLISDDGTGTFLDRKVELSPGSSHSSSIWLVATLQVPPSEYEYVRSSSTVAETMIGLSVTMSSRHYFGFGTPGCSLFTPRIRGVYTPQRPPTIAGTGHVPQWPWRKEPQMCFTIFIRLNNKADLSQR